jgi:hypothetical protein
MKRHFLGLIEGFQLILLKIFNVLENGFFCEVAFELIFLEGSRVDDNMLPNSSCVLEKHGGEFSDTEFIIKFALQPSFSAILLDLADSDEIELALKLNSSLLELLLLGDVGFNPVEEEIDCRVFHLLYEEFLSERVAQHRRVGVVLHKIPDIPNIDNELYSKVTSSFILIGLSS